MGERNIMKKKFLLLFVIIGFLAIYILYIQGIFEKISLEKQELTITKVVSYDELYSIERNQRDLSNEVMLEKTRIWMAKEIQKGELELVNNRYFMIDHPEYDLFEIEFPVTQYIDNNGNIIEFISDKGVITKVHSEEGWEDLKTKQ